MSEFTSYQSPFSWRYGSKRMRQIWSESNKRLLWRKLWVCLAEAQAEFGLVTPEQVADLRAHAETLDISRALAIEAEIRHDLMAELKTFAAQCPVGGGIIHLGATSMDIKDNTEALQIQQSLSIVLEELGETLLVFAGQIERHADTVCMAFTHLQPAEPTTLGYRLSLYAQDMLEDWQGLQEMRTGLRGKGFKGAVGNGASYIEMLGMENYSVFESRLGEKLGLTFFNAANQTYPRRQDYMVLSLLAGLGMTLYRFAFDLRLLQSPTVGELSEPFGEKQVGSSAMPFKRNPVKAEQIDSLARALAGMPQVAWQNAAHSLLERTLDDSANRRTLLPESFLIVDELLSTTTRIMNDLVVNKDAIKRNLEIYQPFAATERLLVALTKAGANRQEMHERLRQHAMSAWKKVERGEVNDLVERLLNDMVIARYVKPEEFHILLDAQSYLGFAPDRARMIAKDIRNKMSLKREKKTLDSGE